ncbi:MAG TPA: STN domain-containing protein, partial [Bacteroidales bacterium]|nr:STN domain-containing protein [Bacteroidales bacterium]
MIQKTSIILIILTFFVSSLLAGVSTDKGFVLQDGKITISVTNKPIKEILDMIEKEGKCRFMYDDNLEYMNKSVSINVKDVPISVFLEELFKNTDLVTQSMENNLIVITTRAIAQSTGILTNDKKNENSDSQQLALTGIVKDLKTNEPIPFVSVIIKED